MTPDEFSSFLLLIDLTPVATTGVVALKFLHRILI
jgi:hypothetical protein